MQKRDPSELEIRIREEASEELRMLINKIIEMTGGDPSDLILNIFARSIANFIITQEKADPNKIAKYFASMSCDMVEKLSLEEKNA